MRLQYRSGGTWPHTCGRIHGRRRAPASPAAAPKAPKAVQSATFKVPGSGGQWPGYSLEVCRANQSHQARPAEAPEPSWGTAKAGTLTMPLHLGQRCVELLLRLRCEKHGGSDLGQLAFRRRRPLQAALGPGQPQPISRLAGHVGPVGSAGHALFRAAAAAPAAALRRRDAGRRSSRRRQPPAATSAR